MRKINAADFVQKSLDLHLFFLRIMKEHSLFLEAAFVAPNRDLAARAEEFMLTFNILLTEAVDIADGNVNSSVLRSGEVVTDKTLPAEEKTAELSGIPIDEGLTRRELQLRPGRGNPVLERRVFDLNARAISVTRALVEFKTLILREMLECRLYTYNFPLLIEHIRREANFYINHLERLQNKMAIEPNREIMEEKLFWDQIMAEHSLFIAHLLDPTETALINQADDFARLFERLEARAQEIERSGRRGPEFTRLVQDETEAVRAIRDFKNTADELILACQIRSIIVPLLADHVLREANHFLNILNNYNMPTNNTPVLGGVTAKRLTTK